MKKSMLLILGVISLALLCVFGGSPSRRYSYEFAICAMFKNEAPWLKEWLIYHRDVLGANHFYLYQNDSSDNYEEVLRPFIEEGIVELIEWHSGDEKHKWDTQTHPTRATEPWVVYQLGAYNDCLKNRALGKAKWVAMIDIDEFIVPVKGVDSFYSLLRKAEKKHCGSLKIFWKVFGASHVQDLEPGELLTEKLTHRSLDEHDWNQLPKSIHRPEAVKFCMIHEAESLEPGYKFETLTPEQIRIHHYWSRTQNFCLKRRGVADLDDLNQVEDRTMLQYSSAIKNGALKR